MTATLKRLVKMPKDVVARWRGVNGEAVVLTATGEKWRREKLHWRQLMGRWTADRVEAWAATAGYLRVVPDGCAPFKTAVPTVGLALLGKGRSLPDLLTSGRLSRRAKSVSGAGVTISSRCAGPVVVPGERAGLTPASSLPADEWEARLAYYAARAKAKLPLFSDPAAILGGA